MAISFRLDGKVALVTGAGSGIGRATALALAESGADVALTELPDRMEAGEETAETVRRLDRRAIVVPLDQTRLPQIDQAVQSVVDRLGRLDVLVNNAGTALLNPVLDVSEGEWDTVLDTDLKGLFFCARAAARRMIQGGSGGRIVNVASVMGVGGFAGRGAYCAAKAGVVNLTRVMAIEWAEHGINVNAVAPAYVETPLVRHLLENPDFARVIRDRTPMRRPGKPEEVAGAVVFLASPAAGYVTGHTLLVDGGWTAW